MKRPKMDEPTALVMLAPARHTREVMGIDGNFAPMVIYTPRHGMPMMAVLDGEMRLHEELAETLSQMRARLGPAEWIAVTTDAYVRPTGDQGEVPPGTLAQAFADGDPTVIEQMVVVLRKRNRPLEVAVQSYRYLPSEGWEWDQEEVIEGHSGPMVEVINRFM